MENKKPVNLSPNQEENIPVNKKPKIDEEQEVMPRETIEDGSFAVLGQQISQNIDDQKLAVEEWSSKMYKIIDTLKVEMLKVIEKKMEDFEEFAGALDTLLKIKKEKENKIQLLQQSTFSFIKSMDIQSNENNLN